MAMRIFMNGDEVEIEEGTSIEDVILSFKLPKQGLAVAVNEAVVPKENWQSRKLADGDTVMLIRAVQGG